ncbi:hypothetical protein L0F63_004389, partial [Massospora cicadina]
AIPQNQGASVPDLIAPTECKPQDQVPEKPISDNSTAAVETAPQIQEFTILSEEQNAAIVRQVAFYFSDLNLPYDKFFKEQVKSDSEGFVKLEVILKFKRMEPYKDCLPQVSAALRSSQDLIVSEDGLKVRRKAELNLDPLAKEDRKQRSLFFGQFPQFPKTNLGLLSIEFSQLEYALKLHEYFKTTPCVFKDLTFDVKKCAGSKKNRNELDYCLPATNILKLSGFSGGVDYRSLYKKLGNDFCEFVAFIGTEKKRIDEECHPDYCYIGVLNSEFVPALLEKLNSSKASVELNNVVLEESEEKALNNSEEAKETLDQSEDSKEKKVSDDVEICLTATTPTDIEVKEAHRLFVKSRYCPLKKY